jgi:MoaA/NifB/PqqE/SkfB family radical SAM enzyme
VSNKISLAKSLIHSQIHATVNKKPVHPLFIHFECTEKCNMKCEFCNIWRKKQLVKEATTYEINKRITECWDLGCFIISFTGGEPLLRTDIDELLKFSKKQIGLCTGLVTNGILLNKKINEISKFTDFLSISFDVNDKQMFNQIRGIDSFEKVKKNIIEAKKMGVEIELFSVITKETFQKIDSTINFAKKWELPIHFSPVSEVPREFIEKSKAKKMMINKESYVIKKLIDEKRQYRKIHFEKDYFKFLASGGFNNFINCYSASTTISLKPDASVILPCPFFTLMKIDKTDKLINELKSIKAIKIRKNCGNWNFCKNCSINCMYVTSLIKYPYLLLRWIKDKI